MKIDREDLRRHYASLSDEELAAVDPDELTELARGVYEEEIGSRNPQPEESEVERGFVEEEDTFDEHAMIEPDGEEPEWLPDASVACGFTAYPGGDHAARAAHARAALTDAGIPSFLVVQPPDEPGAYSQLNVMVPGGLYLHAASVLDKEIFNDELEPSWRNHFEALSDKELRAVNPQVICAGLQDRIDRLKRAYADELARRKITRG